MWATTNVIPKSALNCPLFDLCLKTIGVNATPHQHVLESTHLPVIDRLICDENKKLLQQTQNSSW